MRKSRTRSGRTIFYAALAIYAVAGIVLIFLRTGRSSVSERDLQGIPVVIGAWTGTDIPLSDDVLAMVRPDSYVFRNYRKGDTFVNLYVAFYRTIARSDLAHSPIICYQSQGWTIDDRKEERLSRAGEERGLDLSRMIIEKGDRTEAVYFWYQARGYSSAGLSRMRLKMLMNKFFGRDRLNSFVRVASLCRDPRCGEAEKSIQEFIETLGPHIDAILR
jgi:EpsI family protein